jgi:hypothetical protein
MADNVPTPAPDGGPLPASDAGAVPASGGLGTHTMLPGDGPVVGSNAPAGTNDGGEPQPVQSDVQEEGK